MPHINVRNRTTFAYDALVLADEEGRFQYVPLVQATYGISAQGVLALLEEQPGPDIAGAWHGDPALASPRLEPQIAITKLATDVVLLGHAHAEALRDTAGQVGIRVGPVHKVAAVIGNRKLVRRGGRVTVSAAEPFERIPLIYERAFGGWDRRNANPMAHRCEPRNPVGTGFCDASQDADAEVNLPNFEDPQRPFRAYGDTPPPVGFGFIAANWQPRLAFGGTYDAEWDQTRKPLLPRDFDRRFFNAASPGLTTPGHLRGDEQVTVIGAAPEGRVQFPLPGVPAPVCMVELRGRKRVRLQTALDTVIVDMDQRVLTLMWRSHLPVRNGPHDVVSVELLPDAPDGTPASS